MNERHPPPAHKPSQLRRITGGGRGKSRHAAWVGVLTPQHGERAHLKLDPGGAQVVGEWPRLGKHDERRAAVTVKTRSDQVELTIGAVVPARGVNEQDGRSRAAQLVHRPGH